jgi:hypothetical protein
MMLDIVAVYEREALLVELEQQKKQDAIAEIDEHRKKRQADKEAESQARLEPEAASTTTTTPVTTLKLTKRPRRPKAQRKILAMGSLREGRRSSDASVGTRVPTPPVAQPVWKSPEDGHASEWIKVGTGKWDTRKHLQDSGAATSAAETTAVEAFAPATVTVRELLTDDSKFQPFLGRRVSQIQLTIEDIDEVGTNDSPS